MSHKKHNKREWVVIGRDHGYKMFIVSIGCTVVEKSIEINNRIVRF